jgi:hypothetical protein
MDIVHRRHSCVLRFHESRLRIADAFTICNDVLAQDLGWIGFRKTDMRLLLFLFRYLYAALVCLYVFTLGVFSPRHRHLIFTISHYFDNPFRNPLKLNTPILPAMDLSEIVGATGPITVLEPGQRNGNVSYLEVFAVNSLVAFYRPKMMFEIGTFDGRTSLNMANSSPSDSIVYTLDLPASQIDSAALPISSFDRNYIDKEISGSRIAGQDCAAKIIQLSGDSATFDYDAFWGKMNFVLVDGAHTYEYALSDSEVARRLLGDNEGIILWHDYGNCEGVTRALNHLYSKEDFWRGMRWIRGTYLVCLKSGSRLQ